MGSHRAVFVEVADQQGDDQRQSGQAQPDAGVVAPGQVAGAVAEQHAGHRDRDPLQPPKLADKLRAIADREQAFFRDLRRAA